MRDAPPGSHTITVPRRALIVQRVLVDGWTSAEVAATFGVLERQVDAWVADYRRHGMTSLRRAASETLPAKILPLTISRSVRKIAFRMARGFRRLFVSEPPSRPLPLRRSKDDRICGE
jgi:transposase-like protein